MQWAFMLIFMGFVLVYISIVCRYYLCNCAYFFYVRVYIFCMRVQKSVLNTSTVIVYLYIKIKIKTKKVYMYAVRKSSHVMMPLHMCIDEMCIPLNYWNQFEIMQFQEIVLFVHLISWFYNQSSGNNNNITVTERFIKEN